MAKKEAESGLSLNIDELKDYLRHIIKNNRYIQGNGKTPVAVEIEGDSGLGKTSAALQLGKELGLDVVKLNLSQIEEIGDLVGFPVKEYKMVKGEEEKWVIHEAMESCKEEGYLVSGQSRMSYSPPEWIANKKAGGILLLDDYSRAELRFIQATMELIDRQTYISWKLPEDWHIILTTNPDNGEYLVTTMDNAQRTRVNKVAVKFDVKTWAKWAEEDGIDGRCINFLLMHPEVITEKTNARSVSTFFNTISSFENFEDNLPMIQMLGEGSVGPHLSTLFTTFIANRLDKIMSPKEIVNSSNWNAVKDALTKTIGVNEKYRADIAGVLSTRIINYTVTSSHKEKVTPKIIDRIKNLVESDIFADDLKFYIVRAILNGNQKEFSPMMTSPGLVKYMTK